MKTFLDECVWIVLGGYLLIILLAGTLIGNPMYHAYFDMLRGSSEQLRSLPSKEYPIYSVLLSRARDVTVSVYKQDIPSGFVRQIHHDATRLFSSDEWKPECVDLLLAAIRSSQRRTSGNKNIPFTF
ncbi:MAG: hypothetical protein H7282_05305 [Cytophagaceae bacterium]|nr:hypothetical protein [Cytophagaceae bacterium]